MEGTVAAFLPGDQQRAQGCRRGAAAVAEYDERGDIVSIGCTGHSVGARQEHLDGFDLGSFGSAQGQGVATSTVCQ